MNGMTGKDWSMLIVLSTFWGCSFLFIGIAVKELPPLCIVALRVSLAALALLGITRLLHVALPQDRTIWGSFLIMGMLNNVIPFSLIVWAQTSIAGGLASILNATTPLMTIIVAHYLTADEKVTPRKALGILTGFIGVALVMGPQASQGANSSVLACLAVLGAALSYAFASLFGRRFRAMGVSPVVSATGQVMASTTLLAPITLVVDQPWTLTMPGWQTWVAIAGLAIFSTALAYVLFFRLLASAGATNLMLVTLLVPVSALLLGWFVLDEALEPTHFAGMAVIAAGLLALDGRVMRLIKRSQPTVSLK
ncbi:DMT family transporter [Pseudomonas sp. MAG002Y]|uniref:DMT family transporter n=1 Tax=Pseudomonas sp. MAG002Y TaxID=2678690 RepID=UPI001C608717|nr:DMT family transporter [Pseudomonas sp. MAG002Y]